MNSIKQIIQKPAIFVLVCLALYSCKTEEVYFNITKPAPVTIPSYVKRVGIVNRSLISDSNGVRKKIDDVLSIKGANLDKECSNECIRGLKDGLAQGDIFKNIVFLDSVKIKNSFPGAFPSPLSWDTIEKICSIDSVDVLFALELFHTGNKLNLIADLAALRSPVIGTSAGVNTNVNVGWRIYDPRNKLILDAYPISEGLNFTISALDPIAAASVLMNHKQYVMGVSYQIGQFYASRIIPYIIRVHREFYIKGNINFKMARRMADAGDWNNAAVQWNKETTNPKLKLRAQAYYDLAIIREMNGDIGGAIDYAKQAYETGGKRLALLYLNKLQYRKTNNDILNSQAHGQ